MTDTKNIEKLAEKLKNMDDAGRDTAKIVIEALYARSQFGEKRDERSEEERSPAERTDDSHEKL